MKKAVRAQKDSKEEKEEHDALEAHNKALEEANKNSEKPSAPEPESAP